MLNRIGLTHFSRELCDGVSLVVARLSRFHRGFIGRLFRKGELVR